MSNPEAGPAAYLLLRGEGKSENATSPAESASFRRATVLHLASNVCTLDVVVPDGEFVAMVEATNCFRSEVWALGMTGTDINANVRARLYWNFKVPELPAGREALANEIHALLDNSKLSASQAAQLEREYFPPRGQP